MHLIQGNSEDSVGQLIAGYFVRNTGYPAQAPYRAIGWVHDGQIVGQCVFSDYTEANIEIHLYAPKCFSRKTIKDVYNYVFNTLKCERLTAKPYCTNEKLLQLLERIGFVYEFTQEKYYKEGSKFVDAKVYKLTKDTIPNWINIHA